MFFLNNLKKYFSKGDKDAETILPVEEKAVFELIVDNICIGILTCADGEWNFHYTEEFKNVSDQYHRITGFSDLTKTYRSQALWPFFRIRIPGLGQPMVRETLEKENIDANNEVALLKRFGYETISNPYRLRVT
ncbi:MAG TPA: hypothetical protein ENJ82_09980 [Bacteroidetes bacterium]|nr:hypothetical protein [Bacteroidota bacterium]